MPIVFTKRHTERSKEVNLKGIWTSFIRKLTGLDLNISIKILAVDNQSRIRIISHMLFGLTPGLYHLVISVNSDISSASFCAVVSPVQ
jgi:hypothetical protein